MKTHVAIPKLHTRRFAPLPLPDFGTLKQKSPSCHLEGLGCVQGGLVDLPQPFC